MNSREILDSMERSPVIAAVADNKWNQAIAGPSEVIFYFKANILTVKDKIEEAHKKGKAIFVHIDLAEGIAKDRFGIEFLKGAGVDGILSTRGQLIRAAKDLGLITVQRFFALDSQGVDNISDQLFSASPDFMELMPGVIGKIISRFSGGSVPVIAGGLVESKAEVTEALGFGAVGVSTGKIELWSI